MGGRRQKFRPLNPGIYIIGEGITEQFYFSHLKKKFRAKCNIRPRLFDNTCITEIENTINELLRSSIHIICVFDTDVAKRNQKENERLKALQKKYKNNKNVTFCDSLPSIEYWFLLHYRDTCPYFNNSKEAESELIKHLPNYEKTKKFLSNIKWVEELTFGKGSIEDANERAQKYKPGNSSYSNIFEGLIKLKILSKKN